MTIAEQIYAIVKTLPSDQAREILTFAEFVQSKHSVKKGREVARIAEELYENTLRHDIETEENIGKMVIIDIETGDYEIDETGIEASRILREKRPLAQLFGIRIGYDVAASFGSVMERRKR